MSTPKDAARQLERAQRLVLIARKGVQRTPVHKSLEQLFSDARGRVQPTGSLGGDAFGTAAGVHSRLLQGPKARLVDKEVADFSLSPFSIGGGLGPAASDPLNKPNVGLREFFGVRFERALLGLVEEAHRDCMRSLETHSFNRIQADWDETKESIMGMIMPQQKGMHGGVVGVGQERGVVDPGAPVAVSPPQDAAIITALLSEPMSQQLVHRISTLSCDSCPQYRNELFDCWRIVSHALDPNPEAVTCGAIRYLEAHYEEDVRAAVFHSPVVAHIGGTPDHQSLVLAYGRVKFDNPAFPSTVAEKWYAVYVAARCGFADLLVKEDFPCADAVPNMRTVCVMMARRLQATSFAGHRGSLHPLEQGLRCASGDVDRASLMRLELAEDSCATTQEILRRLLLGQRFPFNSWQEGTVEDWLWFRLHTTRLDPDKEVFAKGLDQLRQDVLNLPQSHYDQISTGVSGGTIISSAGNGFSKVAQTLNYAKVLLLTAQFTQAVRHLRSQERCLHGPALHIALVLHRANAFEAAGPDGTYPLNVTSLVCEHASQFGSSEQLQYLRILDKDDRLEAFKKVLLSRGMGNSDELLGYIDAHGRHTPGLLEKTLGGDGSGGQAEFTDLCCKAGHTACEHGQYREALRLFHLSRCHTEVLQVLRRCLSLPVWNDPAAAASDEATLLSQDIQRFFSIYERNLDRYALSSHAWAVARKLYASRMFHSLCSQGQPLAALDVFDTEHILPLAAEPPRGADTDSEIVAEYPRIVDDYVRILRHAAGQGVINAASLRSRVRQLQAFLAMHLHHIVLQQDTTIALANLSLC